MQSADFAKVLRKESEFDKSNYYASISDYVIEWLSENDEIMPMYLQPWQVRIATNISQSLSFEALNLLVSAK